MKRDTTPSLGITWQQPTFLLPLFCLCTLLGSTASLVLGISMAILIMVSSICSQLLFQIMHRLLPRHSSTALWLILSGTLIALLELALHIWCYAIYQQLGLFAALSIISCLLLARREMLEQSGSLLRSVQRTLLMSAGYALAAVVLGVGRELVGHGSLFADAGTLWGHWARPLELQIFRADMGFLLAVLAPGAFVGLGLGVALYNWLWLMIRRKTD